ncbi:MAG: TRAP transporter substrate-binding protein DctP [Myxococcales bacterium]|nr:TRAP transporter substrate-binding protein DctP [Myxococcales bacterium]
MNILRIGTLAQRSSPWGTVLSSWSSNVYQKTRGALELEIFFNGQQGDEGSMVRKLGTEQLAGAVLSAAGLSRIHRPIAALQMPLFSSWAQLDAARAAMRPEFERAAMQAGFEIAGWGDVGLVRLMARGHQPRVPQDLRGKRAVLGRDDPNGPALYSTIGQVSTVSLHPAEVLPSLNVGAVDAFFAPALVAEQFRWADKVDAVVDHVVGTAIGGIVFATGAFYKLPADLRETLRDTSMLAAGAMTRLIRREDDAAWLRLRDRTTVSTLSATEETAWNDWAQAVRSRLSLGTYPPALVTHLEGFAQ